MQISWMIKLASCALPLIFTTCKPSEKKEKGSNLDFSQEQVSTVTGLNDSDSVIIKYNKIKTGLLTDGHNNFTPGKLYSLELGLAITLCSLGKSGDQRKLIKTLKMEEWRKNISCAGYLPLKSIGKEGHDVSTHWKNIFNKNFAHGTIFVRKDIVPGTEVDPQIELAVYGKDMNDAARTLEPTLNRENYVLRFLFVETDGVSYNDALGVTAISLRDIPTQDGKKTPIQITDSRPKGSKASIDFQVHGIVKKD